MRKDKLADYKTYMSVNQFIGNVHLYPHIKHKGIVLCGFTQYSLYAFNSKDFIEYNLASLRFPVFPLNDFG